MTIEEFNNTRFGNGMKVIYKGVENDIVSVDFEESLIGLGDVEEGEIYWVRCENVNLVDTHTFSVPS
jgi:hypothetical protein